MTDPTPNPEPHSCTGTTQDGDPCRVPPLAGAERCVHHAGLPRTASQQDASRRNGRKHGFFATGFLAEEDLPDFLLARQDLEDPVEVEKNLAAYQLWRAGRVAKWEAKNKPTALAMLAVDRVRKALHTLPQPEGEGFDAEELARVVEVLSRKPEVFLKRLPPEVQEKVRAVLREAGVEHGPA